MKNKARWYFNTKYLIEYIYIYSWSPCQIIIIIIICKLHSYFTKVLIAKITCILKKLFSNYFYNGKFLSEWIIVKIILPLIKHVKTFDI
jgi:hypothetical protein